MKLDGRTLDIKELNIQKLKQLFPESFTDGKFDVAKMAQLLGDYNEEAQEKYDFTWHGKGKALKMSQTPSMGTLRPSKADSKDWDNTQNLYIEGDNLEVLKLLQKSYYSKVKMIYIDPPYNTGKDFVYKDNFKDNLANYKELTSQVDGEGFAVSSNPETSGRYHTDWLNMMYPRLRLARNLLTEDGVIFISIDDNEVHNLRKICDEVFGEDNFVGQFIIKSTPNARDYGHIGKMHEYILLYARFILNTITNLLPDTTKKFKYEDIKGGFNIHPLYNSNESFHKGNRPNLYYPFYIDPMSVNEEGFFNLSLEPIDGGILVYPPLSQKNQVQFVWRWGKEKSTKYLNKEIVGYFTNGEWRVVQKMRNDLKLIRSILDDKDVSSRRGTREVEDLFNNKIFSFPKPVGLVAKILKVGMAEDSIILDFFSGSATTAHAVMQLNAEDGGNRKHIMVQLPETTDEKSEAYKAGYKNICEIGKERIRRAGEQIKADLQEKWEQATEEERKEMKNPSELDTGFKVFQLDTSNIKRWNPSEDLDADKLDLFLKDSIDNYVEGRTERDVLYEVILKMGLELTYPIDEVVSPKGTKIYSVALGALMVCLDDKIDLDVADKMIELRQELQPKTWRVLFKDNGFIDDQVKTNIRETLKSAGLAEDAFTTL